MRLKPLGFLCQVDRSTARTQVRAMLSIDWEGTLTANLVFNPIYISAFRVDCFCLGRASRHRNGRRERSSLFNQRGRVDQGGRGLIDRTLKFNGAIEE